MPSIEILTLEERLSGFQKSIKIHNTKIETLQRGNCMMACYANMLGLEQEHCPPLEELMDTKEPRGFWWDVVHFWYNKLGYFIISTNDEQEAIRYTCDPHGLYFAVGGTKRSDSPLHEVIYKEGKLFYDPHPEGEGLTFVTIYEYLVRKN